jgi:hypothetical protein
MEKEVDQEELAAKHLCAPRTFVSTVPINNFCSTQHFFPEHRVLKQKRQSEITVIVRFLALVLSIYVCLMPTCQSTCGWFVCRKMLTWSSLEANHKLGDLPCKDTVPRGGSSVIKLFLFERKFFCNPQRSDRNGGETFLDPSQWWDRRWEKTYLNIHAAKLRWMQVSILMLVGCGLQYWERWKGLCMDTFLEYWNRVQLRTLVKIKKSPYPWLGRPEQGLTFSLKSKDKLTEKDWRNWKSNNTER